jgi:mono/diheme cytochrome c family protein
MTRCTCFVSTGAAVVATLALLMMLRPGAVRAEPDGKAAFERVCSGCHGLKGGGDVGPRLVPFTKSTRELLGIVREGNGQMPAMSARDISDEEVSAVAEYLGTLGGEHDDTKGQSGD